MKDFAEFTEKECLQVWNAVLSNRRHTDEVKTAHFIHKLKKIQKKDIDDVLDLAEEYFHYTALFFKSTEDEKMVFAARAVREMNQLQLSCCESLFDPDSVLEVLKHCLSVEHFLNKKDINLSLHKDVEYIVDYFKATKNVNKKELALLYELVSKNKSFVKILKKY